MSLLRKRLEKLEDRLAPPEGRPFCVWGMTSGNSDGTRRKTDQEIQAEVDAAMMSGAMGAFDLPTVVCWRIES
ncbi:hypothetical protein [Bradyrhizobium erythrophlei]|uniref:Uncharacterized protein n=1 Tax=Bradyrhizobium erythrophlei TaxID=1437360 RepID=A0A1M7T758_9BRAD|nr:hypothetical protein [Bradyrhizobium erythrophlei]SHN66524.1 hypothetical protein SAMN05444170_0972 [Bradyrhizobium erythrophlei]